MGNFLVEEAVILLLLLPLFSIYDTLNLHRVSGKFWKSVMISWNLKPASSFVTISNAYYATPRMNRWKSLNNISTTTDNISGIWFFLKETFTPITHFISLSACFIQIKALHEKVHEFQARSSLKLGFYLKLSV